MGAEDRHVALDGVGRQGAPPGIVLMLDLIVVDRCEGLGGVVGFHGQLVPGLLFGGNRLICAHMFENLTSGPLPSLNALRAFEAVARTGRVTLAAEELHVTHSAVSRQVKALERSLGVRLFSGPKNRLELTAAGRELLPQLTEAFDQI